jgi:hypothetical protein
VTAIATPIRHVDVGLNGHSNLLDNLKVEL